MSHATSRTFSSDFKRFFVRGLVVLLPSVLTLWIVVKAYQFVDTTIAQPINSGIKTALVQATGFWAPLQQSFDPSDEQLVEAIRKDNQARRVPLTPDRATAELGPTVRTRLRAEAIRTWWGERWYMDLIGLMVAVIAVYIAGRLLGGFVGRTLYKKLEGLITQVPIFKQVYPYVKQVVDFLFGSDRAIKFNRVVVLEYPRMGIWSVGFLTGDTLRDVSHQSGDAVTVFIPSSPTPFTGYTITVPREDVVEIGITVDEALRFVVSGGVLVPDHQLIIPPTKHDASLIPVPTGEDEDTAKKKTAPATTPERRRDAG